jgi:hypothetical protein
VVCVGTVFRNRILLGYQQGKTELALYTLALGIFGPFRAGLIFVPQMSNVLVRGRKSAGASLRFLLTLSLLFTLPIALLAWTPVGHAVVPLIYEVTDEGVAVILAYLRYFTPLAVLAGVGMFFTGLLVQSMRTGMVSFLRIANVALFVGMLAVGVGLDWSPIPTMGLSMLVAQAGYTALAVALYLRFGRRPSGEGDRTLRQGEIASFFMPMVVTAILFATSRPIIFRVLTGLNPDRDPAGPDVDGMIAAVGLAFSFNMLFQAAINQFRNLMVTFGRADRDGVRRFMVRVALGLTVVMVFAAATPLLVFFLRDLQNAPPDVLAMARQAVWPMCLAPLVVTWRNYMHGLTMVQRRTGGMIVGGIMRNASVLVFAPLLAAIGLYNHVAAAGMLVLAFAGEALGVTFFTRKWRAELRDRATGEMPDPAALPERTEEKVHADDRT